MNWRVENSCLARATYKLHAKLSTWFLSFFLFSVFHFHYDLHSSFLLLWISFLMISSQFFYCYWISCSNIGQWCKLARIFSNFQENTYSNIPNIFVLSWYFDLFIKVSWYCTFLSLYLYLFIHISNLKVDNCCCSEQFYTASFGLNSF